MEIRIRRERREDYYKVEKLAREAFWNLYFPGFSEHCVIHEMRKHPDFLAELSFVIERDQEIMGAIFYTRSSIKTPNGIVYPTISFGPVFISPKYHRQGLGRNLIELYSIAQAKKQAHKAIPIIMNPMGLKVVSIMAFLCQMESSIKDYLFYLFMMEL